jgi:hypothetical protein
MTIGALAPLLRPNDPHPQHAVFFAGTAGVDPQPHPAPPADFASASRAQQAFVPCGAGPPQHAFAREVCSAIRRSFANWPGAVDRLSDFSAIIALHHAPSVQGPAVRRRPHSSAGVDRPFEVPRHPFQWPALSMVADRGCCRRRAETRYTDRRSGYLRRDRSRTCRRN